MSKFAEYATSTAFSVSLSKNQVDMLCALHQGYFACEQSHFITTSAALQRRGLVKKVRKRPAREHTGKEVIGWKDKLTPAGAIMCDLLKEAGLYVEYKPDGMIEGWGVKKSS